MRGMVADAVGDWREALAWQEGLFTDLAARSNFYSGLGFNRALTDFPPPAFEQALGFAGLLREPPEPIERYTPLAQPPVDKRERGFLERLSRSACR